MSWTITDSETTDSVTVDVMSGPSSWLTSANGIGWSPAAGTTVVSQYGPVRLRSFAIPEFRVTNSIQLAALVAILTGQHRIEVTDDGGSVIAVRVYGDVEEKLLDTPDRDVSPEWRVTAEMTRVP
jgi:hypothetical protein